MSWALWNSAHDWGTIHCGHACRPIPLGQRTESTIQALNRRSHPAQQQCLPGTSSRRGCEKVDTIQYLFSFPIKTINLQTWQQRERRLTSKHNKQESTCGLCISKIDGAFHHYTSLLVYPWSLSYNLHFCLAVHAAATDEAVYTAHAHTGVLCSVETLCVC